MHPLFFRIGAWSWIVTGAAHCVIDVLMRLSSSARSDADALMRGHVVEFIGTSRSLAQLMLGFSIAMGLSMVLVGVLFLLIGRLTADDPARARAAGFAGLAMSVALLVLSAAVLPPPPVALFALAGVAFGAALIVQPRRDGVIPPALVGHSADS